MEEEELHFTWNETDGHCERVVRLSGEVSTPMDLGDFPYDKHTTVISMGSPLQFHEMRMKKKSSTIPFAVKGKDITAKDWIILQQNTSIHEIQKKFGTFTYSKIHFNIPMERASTSFGRQVDNSISTIRLSLSTCCWPFWVGHNTSSMLLILCHEFNWWWHCF